MLTWTIDASGGQAHATHYANFGRGRYSVTRSHGSQPWYMARWHRNRHLGNQGKIMRGASTLEAAKEICERDAARIIATMERKE